VDSQTLLTILWTIIVSIGAALLGLGVWAVKKLIVIIFENTVQIKILNKHIDEIMRALSRVDKMGKDISEAHAKIREIKVQIANGG